MLSLTLRPLSTHVLLNLYSHRSDNTMQRRLHRSSLSKDPPASDPPIAVVMRMPTDYQIFTSAPFLIIWHLPTAAEQHDRSALPVLIALSLLLFPPAGMPRGQQKKREMSSRLSTYFCPLLPPSWKREIAPTARTGTMVGTLFPTLPACLPG